MRLAGVRDGDVLRLDEGLTYLVVVHGRRLLVAALTGSWNPAPIKATAVTAHWRRVGPSQQRDHA